MVDIRKLPGKHEVIHIITHNKRQHEHVVHEYKSCVVTFPQSIDLILCT